MRKRLALTLLPVLLLGPLAGADDAGSYAGEVTASQLHLRAGPSEQYQSVLLVDRGTLLVVRGRHPNVAEWLVLEVPGGYAAWVSADLVTTGADGTGTVKGDRVLVRPRPSTRWHELSGRLERGETLRILGEKTEDSMRWLQIEVPSRFPLYAHTDFLKRAGPVSLAMAKVRPAAPAEGAKPAPPAATESSHDKQFVLVEKDVREKLAGAKASSDLEPLRRAVDSIDRAGMSMANRERRIRLLSEINDTERRLTLEELKAKEWRVRTDLEAKLEEIQRNYQRRLREIEAEYETSRRPVYIATGIVQWRPDVFGRTPAYRIEEGGKMSFYLIAPDYDLQRFVGKRVGVTGIKDTESGTGFETVMIRRIEILGDK